MPAAILGEFERSTSMRSRLPRSLEESATTAAFVAGHPRRLSPYREVEIRFACYDLAMILSIEPQPAPLHIDEDGIARVGRTRVTPAAAAG